MSAFDRIEPRLPGLLGELAAARVPDYFEDMLDRTAGTRQRMGVRASSSAAAGAIRALGRLAAGPARPLAILLILAIVLVAGGVLVVGSLPRQLPPPFGPARNGALLMETADGDIVSVDIESGATRMVVGGPTIDVFPLFTELGDRFFFIRRGLDGREALLMANDDGSDVHEILAAGPPLASIGATPGGDRILVARAGSDRPGLEIVDVEARTAHPLDLANVDGALWRPLRDQLIIERTTDGRRELDLANGNGSIIRRIETAGPIAGRIAISPDGLRLAYLSWDEGHPSDAQLRIVDIESGADGPVTPAGDDEWILYGFSPDGTRLLAARQVGETSRFQLVLIPAGGGDPRVLERPGGTGPPAGSHDVMARFSPDGRSVLVDFRDDGTSWLLSADDGSGQQLSWTPTGQSTWQRLAP